MVKKAKPTSRSDVMELQDWLADEIQAARDDTAVAILDLLKSEEGNRFEQIKNRIEEHKANMAQLKTVWDWCRNDEAEDLAG